jgi:hypothetical protein
VCDDHSNHGGFNIEGGYYNCWRCGSSTIPWIIQELLGVSFGEAKAIQDQFDREVDYEVETQQDRQSGSPLTFTVPGSPIEERHEKYLLDRGYNPTTVVRKYGVLGTGRSAWLAHRIVIPIFYRSRAVSWQARSIIKDNDLRYLTCPKEQKLLDEKRIFYNLDNCPGRRVMLVEGIFDVWRLGDGACATFGTTTVLAQVNFIGDRFDEIFILFDPEPDAQERAELFAHEIAMIGKFVQIVRLTKEPDDLTRGEVYQLREELGFGA